MSSEMDIIVNIVLCNRFGGKPDSLCPIVRRTSLHYQWIARQSAGYFQSRERYVFQARICTGRQCRQGTTMTRLGRNSLRGPEITKVVKISYCIFQCAYYFPPLKVVRNRWDNSATPFLTSLFNLRKSSLLELDWDDRRPYWVSWPAVGETPAGTVLMARVTVV